MMTLCSGQYTWTLYRRPSSGIGVPLIYTFLVNTINTQYRELKVFKEDLYEFIKFLATNFSLGPGYYLNELHAGSEYARGGWYLYLMRWRRMPFDLIVIRIRLRGDIRILRWGYCCGRDLNA